MQDFFNNIFGGLFGAFGGDSTNVTGQSAPDPAIFNIIQSGPDQGREWLMRDYPYQEPHPTDDWVQESFQNMANEAWEAKWAKQRAAAATAARDPDVDPNWKPVDPKAVVVPDDSFLHTITPDDSFLYPKTPPSDSTLYGEDEVQSPTQPTPPAAPAASQPRNIFPPPMKLGASNRSLQEEVKRTFSAAVQDSITRRLAMSGTSDGLPDFRGPTFRDGKRVPAAIRYNNPGAQWPGPSARKFGAVETVTLNDHQRNKIAVFPDAVSGAAAHFDLLARSYTGKPLDAAIRRWSGGNHSEAYAQKVAKTMGISTKTILTPAMFADPNFAIPFAKAMASVEASRPYPLSDEYWKIAFMRFQEVNRKLAGAKK